MLQVFEVQNWILMSLTFFTFALEGWAFIDASARKPAVFIAAGKLTKPGWMIILGLAVAAHMLIWHPFDILNLAGTVAAIVYLVDARPAMISLTRRR